ncbi:hypothetical protein KKHLCK_13335 [Candidatus Electrothrix laxa]
MICIKKTAILTLSLATTWSANALAQPQNSISKPPTEAYTACDGKQPGEKSSLVSQMGNTISGECKQQQDGRLLLIPDHLARKNGNGIPEAAYQNCIGKKVGDEVQVTISTGKTISGTCQLDGDRLYLRPNSPPGMNAGMKTHKEGQYQELQNGSRQPEDMHSNIQQQQPQQAERGNGKPSPPEAAYKACEGKKAGEEIQLTTQHGRSITGKCVQEGDRLFMRPDRTGQLNGNNPSGGGRQQPQSGRSNGKPSPPEAAYKACEGKTVGDEVQLTNPQGKTITGKCEQDGDILYLRPEQNRRKSADTTTVEPSINEPEAQQPQQPQEEPDGFWDGVKSFWKNLW